VAPLRAIASAKIPPPQPTSSTVFPSIPTCSSIQPKRRGLIICSGLNSLSISHQWWARLENFSSSAGSTLIESVMLMIVQRVECLKKKPRLRGFFSNLREITYVYRPLRFRRDGFVRGQPWSCCQQQAELRPCLLCTHGSCQCPWIPSKPSQLEHDARTASGCKQRSQRSQCDPQQRLLPG